MHRGAWETPLGTVEIDSELAGAIVGESGIIDPDETAHLAEHSCEVHVPFVQYFTGDFRIVPVTMWMQDHETAADVGHAVASASGKPEGMQPSSQAQTSHTTVHRTLLRPPTGESLKG